MEWVLYYSIGIACFVAFTYLAWATLNFVWFTPKRIEKCLRQQGLKGNSYKLLFGDMGDNAKMGKEIRSAPISTLSNDYWPRLSPIFHHGVKDHGKNSFVWFGPRPVLIIADPELIKEILTKIFKFQKPKLDRLFQLLMPGLVGLDGEKWTKHRKIINPAFHLLKLKLMVPALHLSCVEMLNKWDELVSMNGVELDIWPYLQDLTSDGILRTAFGSNYKDGSIIFQLIREQSQLVIGNIKSRYIPGWRFLPTKSNNRMKAIKKEMNASLKNIIKKRMEAIEKGEANNDDLLGKLLDSNLSEIKLNGNDKNVGMSIDEVIEECKLFYLAGQETTASLLVWTLILLSRHQDWQQRAREEVLQVLKDETPNFDSVNQLKVMTMILYEVLRLYSPTIGITRMVHEEIKLGEMCIPSETMLFLPITLLHHDPEFWGEDAKEFRPERFSEGVSKATKNQLIYYPFGWGPRICIGQNFAMLEVKMTLSMLLRRFSFELSPSYSHAPISIITVQPQNGAHLILRKL